MQTLFITSSGLSSERWLAAFPKATVITGAELKQQQINTDYIVWILLQGEWDEHLSYCLDAGAKVIAMTLAENVDQAQELVTAGASGYVHAFAAPKLLKQIEQVVLSGGAWLGAGLLRKLLVNMNSSLKSNEETEKLTKREKEVAACIAVGKSNKEIAQELGVTERTVKAHLSVCFKKLNVRDRVQLALVIKQ